MTSVTKAVQENFSQNLILQEAINLGILSYNKLAEYIKPDIEELICTNTKISSIAMAIRRYIKKMKLHRENSH